LAVPMFALEYMRQKNPVNAVRSLAPFAAAFAVSFILWAWLDGVFQLPTMARTFTHYITYAMGSNYDLAARVLRLLVAVARIGARLTPPLALALGICAYGLWRERGRHRSREADLLVISFAWIAVGAITAVLATQGNVPAYFAPFVPAIALVVGHFCSKAKGFSLVGLGTALFCVLAYFGLLLYLDFNEVNLLLMPYAAAGALALGGLYWFVDRDLNRLVAVLVALSMATSAFMLTDFRTYDAMRSQSVADAAAYLNSVGAERIAESQERTLDLYVSGRVEQYEDVRCLRGGGGPCSKEEQVLPVPPGYYVVDFPLRPLELEPNMGVEFRFNLFDKSGVERCELVRTYEVHSVLVSEFYKC
ncbi:MAG: hypothetical protein KAT35_06020, partial [Candidatus Aenigmarchaeota archaeon]|nr:hypothetical protein [Candidatus Aenigmarchaeota archaeon]